MSVGFFQERGHTMVEGKDFQRVYHRTWKSSMLIITFHKKEEKLFGKIYNMHIPYGIGYDDPGDMILKMDRIYDLLAYPESTYETRKWDDSKKWEGTILENDNDWNYDPELADKINFDENGFVPAVIVETRYRQNGSWQGIMNAGGKKIPFRSSLEFLHLFMDYTGH